MKKPSVLSRFLIFLNWLAAFALLVCYLSCFIPPDVFIYPALWALGYPVFAIINLLFLIYWILRLRRWFFISAIALIAGFSFHQNMLSLGRGNGITSAESNIKLMTYNVLVFNKNNTNNRFQHEEEMISLMKESEADIICLQEFYTLDGRFAENQLDKIKIITGLPHFHFNKLLEFSESGPKWGLSIFSRYPILDAGDIKFQHSGRMNAATWVDLQVNNKKFRVYNAHLESINLSDEDLEFMKESVPVRKKRPRLSTLSKFCDAFEIRATQARELKRHAEGVDWPVIISGDFNDTPISYTFRTLSSGKSNAFRESGWGFSKSHTSIPFLCIDYILADPQIHFQKFQKIKVDYSDHYPLVAEFSIE